MAQAFKLEKLEKIKTLLQDREGSLPSKGNQRIKNIVCFEVLHSKKSLVKNLNIVYYQIQRALSNIYNSKNLHFRLLHLASFFFANPVSFFTLLRKNQYSVLESFPTRRCVVKPFYLSNTILKYKLVKHEEAMLRPRKTCQN